MEEDIAAMIKFLYPQVLNYSLAVAVGSTVIFLYVLYNKRRIHRLTGSREDKLWYAIQLAKLSSIILLFIALALPVSVETVSESMYAGFSREDVGGLVYNLTALHVILVDESLSMLYTDSSESNTTRFEYALNFTRKYLESLNKYDQVMIVGFAEDPRKICIGSASYCETKLFRLKPGRNFTDLNAALGYVNSYIHAAQYPAVVVIVSDGACNHGGDPYRAIVNMNKSGNPVLFVRIGLDQRANKLLRKLELSGIKVVAVNEFTKELVEKLARDVSHEMRIKSFLAKKILEIKVIYEDIKPYPTIALLVASLLFFTISRLEGY